VQEVCLHGEGGGLREEFTDLETGLQADRICTGEQKSTEGRFEVRELDLDGDMKRLGYMESLPIVPITHSSYMSCKRLGFEDLKRGQ
jgi:hypothetical protein